MTTKPTEEERIQFLDSLKKAIESITERLEETNTRIDATEKKLDRQVDIWEATTSKTNRSIEDAEELVREIGRKLDEFRSEASHSGSYYAEVNDTLKERFQLFVERFDNQGRTLQILEDAIRGVREIDLDRVNERLKELPSLEVIRRELSNSTSPLVSRNDFVSLSNQVSKLEGSVSSHFRNNLIGILLTLATIVGTNIFTYSTLASKVDSIETSSSAQNDPAPNSSSENAQ